MAAFDELKIKIGKALIKSFLEDENYKSVVSILKRGFPLTEGIIQRCINTYDLEIYKFLYPEHLQLDPYMMLLACKVGNIDLAKWMRSKGCPWDKEVCNCAAENGHLEILTWLIDNGSPHDEDLANSAARGGQLEILKFLKERKFRWNDRLIFNNATSYGHLEVLKWLRDNEFRWTTTVCICAALKGHVDILKWAIENGCPYDLDDLKANFDYNPLVMEYLNTL